MTNPARAKGRRIEHEAARLLGGKRTVLSGAIAGEGDIHPGDPWAGSWVIEVKARKRMSWTVARQALEQARAAKGIGDRRAPMAVLKEDHGPLFVLVLGEDLVSFVGALAEIAQGSNIKRLVRQAQNILQQIKDAV